MWWKKYSGYKKPLDKLKQWTQVNKRECSRLSMTSCSLVGKNHLRPQVCKRMRDARPGGRAVPAVPTGACARAARRLPQPGTPPHSRAAPRPGSPRSRPIRVSRLLPGDTAWRKVCRVEWPWPCAPREGQPASQRCGQPAEEGLSGAPAPGKAAGELLGGDGEADSWLDLRTDVLTRAVNHGASGPWGSPRCGSERRGQPSVRSPRRLPPGRWTLRERSSNPISQTGWRRQAGLGGPGAPRVSCRACVLSGLWDSLLEFFPWGRHEVYLGHIKGQRVCVSGFEV